MSDKRAKLTLKRRKTLSNDRNLPSTSDTATTEKTPRLAGDSAFVPALTSSQTAASRENTDPRLDSMSSEARGDRQGGVGRDCESEGPRSSVPDDDLHNYISDEDVPSVTPEEGIHWEKDLKRVFELLMPKCGSYVWTDLPELPPMCQKDDPSELKLGPEAELLLSGRWPSEVTWSPLPPQS